jgi:large subunit ribosomal protein L24
MRKIRSGDTVLVTSGRNKGQQGKVRVNMIERDRVGHRGRRTSSRSTSNAVERGMQGIVEVEAALHVSNVMLICPNCKQPTRVGVREGSDGKNVRYCKKCDGLIPRPEAA